MKYKSLFFSVFCSVLVSEAMAVKLVSDPLRTEWMETVKDNSLGDMSSAGDFILYGAVGMSGGHGTYGDEYAIVSVVAKQIVPHGGYFCPQQIQCANKNCHRKSWTLYFKPDGYSEDKCAWFCEAGYSGTNCAPISTIVGGMDRQTNVSGLYSGLGLKTSGKHKEGTENSIYALDTFYLDKDTSKDTIGDYDEVDVLLGVVEFKEHGVIAGPVSVRCHTDKACQNHSYVYEVAQYSKSKGKLLCAEGYISDSSGTDCVKLTQDTLNLYTAGGSDKGMCSGWSESGYDSNVHSIDASGDCVKFLCKDRHKAFPGAGNFECVDCAASIRGGQDPKTGLCVQCSQVGQYFDVETSTCEKALGFSKTDLQYGQGKTKNSNPNVGNQCWTKSDTDSYRNCVIGPDPSGN